MEWPVHDTIVVCRPAQVREAAIVLSCCPSDRFTPLIVIEAPPISESGYRRLYDAYVEARNARDAMTGGGLARQQARQNLRALRAAVEETDRRAEALTPYRSWWRHQRLVAELLEKLPLRRAVFLFEPKREEIELSNALPISRIGEELLPTLPSGLEKLFLVPARSTSGDTAGGTYHVYGSLAELTRTAWAVLRLGVDVPRDTVRVVESDATAYFGALSRALALGVPLQPCAEDTIAYGLPIEAGAPAAPTEAVLVEVTDDAVKLLGVQYAHLRKAKLILYPEPDSDAIEQARRAIEVGAGDIGIKGARKNIFGQLREYIFGDFVIGEGVKQLEREVSKAVPDEVVSAVADLDLTAFTSRMPYNFLKKNGADWSTKAIGHIAGDTTLLMLTELCWNRENGGVGFSLIFDPGFFATSETDDVVTVLKKRLSYPLLLRGNAGSSLALLHFGPTMPLDFVFFNTHGTDNTIELRDGPLPAFKLLQRQTLASRPFVFNSSCQSWVGVGREFIRVGARGYIGTLWSIDAEAAARYAEIVVKRTTLERQPVSHALRNTGIDPSMERGYIYIGTCGARLEEARPADADTERRRVASAAEVLLDHAARLLADIGISSDIPFPAAIVDLLWQEAEQLLAEYDRRWPAPHVDRVKLYVSVLRMLSYLVERHRDKVVQRLALVAKAEQMLDGLALPAKSHAEQLASLMQYAGRIRLKLGDVKLAIELLEGSIQAAERNGLNPAAYLELCDALRYAGLNDAALEVAKRADAAYSIHGPPRGRTGVVGRLAQISRALGKYDDALRYARQGVDLATQLDEKKERAEFKGDEARILLQLKRYDEALAAAEEFLKFARYAYDETRELNSYGVMAQAWLGKDDLSKAAQYATQGLKQARALNNAESVGDFLTDICEIYARRGEHVDALDSALEAASIFAKLGRQPKTHRALARAGDAYLALVKQDGRANTWEPLSRYLATIVEIMNHVDFDTRRAATCEAVFRVKDLVAQVGIAPLRHSLETFARKTASSVVTPSDRNTEQRVFITRSFQMFADVAAGRFNDARVVAAHLDQLSNGRFELQAFVDEWARKACA